MAELVKVNNVWTNVAAIYKRISSSWVLQENGVFDVLDRMIYFYQGHINNATLSIVGESSYTGKNFLLGCKFGGLTVYPTWTLVSGTEYASINENGKVTITEGALNNTIVVRATYRGETDEKTITVSYDNQLTIEGLDTMAGTSGNVIARYNSTVVDPTWSITSGQEYGTIDSSGNITIIGSGQVTVSATYNNYTTTKNIILQYNANSSSSTEVDPDTGTTTTTTTTTETDPETGATTETTTTTVVNDDGSSSNTSTETTTNQDGSSSSTSTTTNSDGSSSETTSTTSAPDENGTVTTNENTSTTNSDGTSSETTSTIIENEDGSSSSSSSTVNYDENGDTTGSSSNETTNNADGSSTSSTTNYNAEGDPTDQQNVATDTTGNVDTQDVEFDENGDPTVTGYTIDTEASEGTGKDITGNGVDTEFIPFGFPEGFTMHLRFRTTAAEQPNPPVVPDTEDTGANYLYNIMSAKATAKVGNIWPGFDIRWAVSTSGSTTGATLQFRRTLVGETSSIQTSLLQKDVNNVYDLIITYNSAENNNRRFTVHDNLGKSNLVGVNKDLQDNMDLEVTLGYALNMQGQPYRYASVTIYDFSVNRLDASAQVVNPTITCTGTSVNISCATPGSRIYYRVGTTGKYDLYTEPISISADTTVEAYAIFQHKISEVISENCIYDDGSPNEPVITCDGEHVTITCSTTGATIYYRLGTTGNYSVYTSPIEIFDDTVVYAYSELEGLTSSTVSENCIYDNGIANPVIYCDGVYVTITCETPGVDIYYKLGSEGTYTLYDSAIEISEDVTIYAYASLGSKSSSVVSENCIFDDGVKTPVIHFANNVITITCATVGADIYYRLDQGTYALYTGPITIAADTTIDTYASLNGITSTVATEFCEYDSYHNYSLDYLTFDVLTPGTIKWNLLGGKSDYAKTIEYSKNDGAWTSITASTSTTISVAAGDKVRFRGNNTTYAGDKTYYSGFEGGTANFNIEGNIMSLIYGDNFANNSTLPSTQYTFCSIFKKSNVVSAENLILPATTLTDYCYRAMFSYATLLVTPPALPATTLAIGVYWYMFEQCAISTAPDLLATTLLKESYGNMFTGCANLNYIRCLATTGLGATNALQNWVKSVAASGTFIKAPNITWSIGASGIPTGWIVYDEGQTIVESPEISCDGEEITITCDTTGADIYYKLNQTGNYILYSGPISISSTTYVEAYAELDNHTSSTITQNCEFISSIPIEEANRVLRTWKYNNQNVETPYSINRIDGHSSSYSKGTFNFETSFALRQAQPTHLWFQHADQSATIYVDDTLVEKHWGGYTAFTVDISNYVHAGTNNIKVALKNNEGNNLAPAAGDFNFNATLGNVKLLTSPVLPAINYGYDGFHVTSTVTDSSATIYVKTSIPVGGVAECIIDDSSYHFQQSANTTGEEMTFTAVVQNPHLWNGTLDPHLYTITLNIYYQNELYHTFVRGYGLRYYEYVINETVNGNTYTGFLLNGSPYLLRGCCMHDDLAGKANALTDADYTQEFAIIQELGCNFLRLAHYPHPKEVYDWCDRLGIVVQTEAPCVNKLQSTMGDTYYNNLVTQYNDMVNQHYNHPCIMFWGLSNETTTDDKDFGKAKIEQYTAQIKALDSERLVGYVMSHSYSNPSSYYNNPSNVDWFGCNIYVGWYIDKASNDPTSQLNTRVNNIINGVHKALAFSEYGCGGTQHCHSEDPQTTTTKGNYERHDIEYQMWLHEGHIAAIRNFPQLMFTGQWQLFDIAISNRNEGYTVCLDGETVSTDDNLRRLNNKGLVERDHITKKDTFYIYKAEWSSELFTHICGKDYTRMTDRVIKCYTNAGTSASLYVNNTLVDTAAVTDHIVTFTSRTFSSGDVVRVEVGTTSDTLTFA